MFQWTVLILTIFGSMCVAALFRESQKKVIVPLCIAYTFGLVATVGSVGGVLHFLFTAWNFVIAMFLCNGFNQRDWGGNPAWMAFMFFWVYMFAIVFTGYFPIEGACLYMQEFVKTFAAGYFFASWACRAEGAWKRSLAAILVAACFVVYYKAALGGLDANLVSATGRAGLNTDLLGEEIHENVNYIALTTACFLPFLMVVLFSSLKFPCGMLVRAIAGAAFVFLLLILFRTGARNGALALVPCAWYYLTASRKRGLMGRLVIGILIVGGVVVGVGVTMRNADSLRSFDFRGEGQQYYETLEDQLTSGRWSMYVDNIKRLSPLEKIVGKGLALTDNLWVFDKHTQRYYKQTRVSSGNAHSMYMTIFYRAGFIGLFLFVVFLIVAFRQGRKIGDRGKTAWLFLGVWLATGVGEAWGMIGGHTAILAGIGMGLLSNRRALNPDFGELERGILSRSYC